MKGDSNKPRTIQIPDHLPEVGRSIQLSNEFCMDFGRLILVINSKSMAQGFLLRGNPRTGCSGVKSVLIYFIGSVSWPHFQGGGELINRSRDGTLLCPVDFIFCGLPKIHLVEQISPLELEVVDPYVGVYHVPLVTEVGIDLRDFRVELAIVCENLTDVTV